MSKVGLLRTVTVLVRLLSTQNGPLFSQGTDEDADRRDYRLMLDRAVWEEMGSPDVITVTVEPGDRLNSPGDSED